MNRKTILITAALLLSAASSLSAQTIASVPVPSQFATAHTIFLASGAAVVSDRYDNAIATTLYATLYQSLAKAGHYQLVASPAEAGLAMTVAAKDHVSSVSRGESLDEFYLSLEIYDVKTHCLLWEIDEPIQGAFRKKTFQKNLDTSVALLMNDLNALIAGKLPSDAAAPVPAKTRFSQEK